jgi:fucose permease
MFKELLKVIGFLSVFIIGGNLIALCQKVTSTMPGYMMLLTIICMLVVLWYNVVKLIISINEREIK